jgi:phosphopantetheinyl transferase
MIFLSLIREESDGAEDLLRCRPGSYDGHSDKQRRRALGTALLFDLLTAIPDGGERQWRLRREPGGRPTLLEGTAGTVSTFDVSISHSGGWIGCAATQVGRIGLDIEVARPGRPWREIAEAAFGPAEIQRIGDEGEIGFYRAWTLREAIAKATGHGLKSVTDRADRVGDGPLAGAWLCRLDGAAWQLMHCHPANHFNLAIAVEFAGQATRAQPVELKWWHLPPELRNILPDESVR